MDDDPLCLEEYAELVENLGYDCTVAADAAQALRLIAGDPAIGIVVTDLRMPGMDGLTLLDELAHRFMPTRPLVAIVVTGNSTLETAVSAMRSSAVDFLTKPVSLDGMSGALRRAALRWAARLPISSCWRSRRCQRAARAVRPSSRPAAVRGRRPRKSCRPLLRA
ncbi:MAG: response regulator [Novosphingobium sp.]|uniref:response regulator n=1 Tax=Novosphingobium sp. TaxID=1874826 RepID=UPI0022BCE2DE|nr:response regulator [Novosphingobium sp.]MCZ8060922.1 response regulator [Novosphingobium sp.]